MSVQSNTPIGGIDPAIFALLNQMDNLDLKKSKKTAQVKVSDFVQSWALPDLVSDDQEWGSVEKWDPIKKNLSYSETQGFQTAKKVNVLSRIINKIADFGSFMNTKLVELVDKIKNIFKRTEKANLPKLDQVSEPSPIAEKKIENVTQEEEWVVDWNEVDPTSIFTPPLPLADQNEKMEYRMNRQGDYVLVPASQKKDSFLPIRSEVRVVEEQEPINYGNPFIEPKKEVVKEKFEESSPSVILPQVAAPSRKRNPFKKSGSIHTGVRYNNHLVR